MIVVLMGVSGSGKTTIGRLLAQRLGCVFADADDYHSAANKAKMAAGTPLDDADREPWLQGLNRLLLGWANASTSGVLACSALKDMYRQILGQGMSTDTLHFVLLDAPPQLIASRLAHRTESFMNPLLLGSQLATLERPKDALCVVNDHTPAEVVEEIVGGLGDEARDGRAAVRS